MKGEKNQGKLILDVLLVDDDPGDVALFTMAVGQADLNICTRPVETVDRAISYVKGEGIYGDRAWCPFPDLVVLDWSLPHKNGEDFLKWREARRAHAKAPVVVLSGIVDPRTAEKARKLGAIAYLAKPTSFEQWTELIRQIWDLGVQSSYGAEGIGHGSTLADRG